MADFLQSSQTTATQAPDYYNNYLSGLATAGNTAGANAKYVGAQDLQNQAFANVGQAGTSYQPALTAAQNTMGQAINAQSPLSAAQQYFNNANVDQSQLAQQYMNPYTQDVVNSIGTLGQRNI